MAISFQNALGVYESALSLRSEKAALLSNNLANVNTPNYKARDMNFQSELKRAMRGDTSSVKLRSSHKGHIGFAGLEKHSSDRLYRMPNQPSIDGNTVEEQVEHAEFMKNSLEFQTAFTFLNSRFKGLTKAIRGE